MAYYKGTNGVLPSWFEKDYVRTTNQSPPEEIAFSTHAFLVYMLTRSIFYGKSNMIYFHLLLTLEELDLVATHSWGKSLRWVYSNISEISAKQGPHAFLGLCFLWRYDLFLFFQFLSFILFALFYLILIALNL